MTYAERKARAGCGCAAEGRPASQAWRGAIERPGTAVFAPLPQAKREEEIEGLKTALSILEG